MSEVSESLERAEHMEHAGHGHGGHGGGGKGGSGRGMGLTVAILGVLLAICAAMVGSERTDLIKTMVEQANAKNDYQAESTRYRTTLAQVEALNSVAPDEDPEAIKEIAAIGVDASSDKADVINAIRAGVKVQLAQGGPDPETIGRLVKLARAHQQSSDAAAKWAKSYDPVVAAHYEAAEGFERGQVAAEVGIVLASVALLLFRKSVWFASMAVGALAIGLSVMTYVRTHHEIHEGEEHAELAHKHFEETVEADGKKEHDEDTLKELEKAYKLPTEEGGKDEKPKTEKKEEKKEEKKAD